jgi:DNA-directed RNA polymerase specialized sigma subunit
VSSFTGAGAGPRRTDEQFVCQHAGFVRRIALQSRIQLGLDTPEEDLVALGVQGLLGARQRFDADERTRFESFAYYRVRGAILDGVQKEPLPRPVQARLRAALALDQVSEATADHCAAALPGVAAEAKLRAIEAILARGAAAYAQR